jgi:predicted GNAT family N-acyltransferase
MPVWWYYKNCTRLKRKTAVHNKSAATVRLYKGLVPVLPAGFRGLIKRNVIEESMENIILKKIEFGSREYKDELDLRNCILRVPLGLDIYDEDLSGEEDDIHLGAFLNGDLIGVLVLVPTSKTAVRMRQVAVSEGLQGNGIGKQLVVFSEQTAIEEGYKEIVLHARQTAVGFYEKLGYEITSAVFFEIGIPHVEMKKEI